MDQDISFSHEFLFEAPVAEGGDDFVPLWSHPGPCFLSLSALLHRFLLHEFIFFFLLPGVSHLDSSAFTFINR